MLRSPSGSQATPLDNRLEIHDPSDQDTDRLKIEVDETRRLLQNQQDRLLGCDSEQQQRSRWPQRRQAKPLPDSVTKEEGSPFSLREVPWQDKQASVERDDTGYAGMVEAASQPQRPASTVPATRTDRLLPVIGEAIEKSKKRIHKRCSDISENEAMCRQIK